MTLCLSLLQGFQCLAQIYACLTTDGSRKIVVGLEMSGFTGDSKHVFSRVVDALRIYAEELDAQSSVDDVP